jgi:AcrR family transcriptional regulator
MSTRKTLSAEDWIKGAFRALSGGGAQAIRAEAIARDLKVSKGSFYWHFKDVPALKVQMLQHWQDIATDGIIKDVEAAGISPRKQLRALVLEATGLPSSSYGGSSVESAIREWARHDSHTAAILKSVDERRLAYVAQLFRKCGQSEELSATNAQILYGALIGLEILFSGGLAELQAGMLELLGRLLQAEPDGKTLQG